MKRGGAGEAQVIVGSCLVLGSAIAPAVSGFLVESLGYRGLFALLAGVGAAALSVVVFLVPETLTRRDQAEPAQVLDLVPSNTDLSVAR